MFKRLMAVAALAGSLGLATPAAAALSHVGACVNPATNACVITDGSFEYLSVGGARVKSDGLASLLGAGWTLGTRADFASMVARNAPLMSSSWNDAFLPDGGDPDTLEDIVFGTSDVLSVFASQSASLIRARSGDPVLAAAFKDIVLKFGGQNANPAFVLHALGTAEFAGANRYTVALQAYLNDQGESLSRNNVFSGAASTNVSNTSLEAIVAHDYFLLRAAVAPVPEPGTHAMLLAGLAVLVANARRRMARR